MNEESMARNFHIIFFMSLESSLNSLYGFFWFVCNIYGRQAKAHCIQVLAIEIVYITRKLYQFEDKYMHSNYFYRHVLLHFTLNCV